MMRRSMKSATRPDSASQPSGVNTTKDASSAYDENPVEALVEFGYIRADEMANGETVARLHDASNDELLQELARRLKENADADWVNSPIIYREEFDMAANDDPNARLEAETPED